MPTGVRGTPYFHYLLLMIVISENSSFQKRKRNLLCPLYDGVAHGVEMKRIAMFMLVAIIGLSCSGCRKPDEMPEPVEIVATEELEAGQKYRVNIGGSARMIEVNYLGSTISALESPFSIPGEYIQLFPDLTWYWWYQGGPTWVLVKPEKARQEYTLTRGWLMSDDTWLNDERGQYIRISMWDPRVEYRDPYPVMFTLPEGFPEAGMGPIGLFYEEEKIHQYFFPTDDH